MDSCIVAPTVPIAIFSTITVIDASTSVDQARVWLREIEFAYNAHFGEPEPTWTWDDVHDLDRDVLVELEEIVRAGHQPPLDLELVSSFRTPDWRAPYLKNVFSEYQGTGSLASIKFDDIPVEEQIAWQRARCIRSCAGDLSKADESLCQDDWRKAQIAFKARSDKRRI